MRGGSLGQLEEAQRETSEAQKYDLRIEWSGVSWSKEERLGKNLVTAFV